MARTCSRENICGVWYYPTPDVSLSGYWETLTIRADGTFTKFQQYRMFSETYEGVYSTGDDGTVSFHVNRRINDNNNTATSIESHDIEKTYRCRCAVDATGNLIVVTLNREIPPESGVRVGWPDDCFLNWHCYTQTTHEEQLDELMKAILKMAPSAE